MTGGLKGRVMKQIWSGTWTGGSITIPELPYYNVFVAAYNSGIQEFGIGIRRPGASSGTFFGGNIANGRNNLNVVKFSASGTTLNMEGSAIAGLGGSYSFVPNSVGVYRIWGVL